MTTPTRWSSTLPYLRLTDVMVPAEAVWADISDQYFRMYVALNGIAQEDGQVPSDRDMARRLAQPTRRVRHLRAALERVQLEVVTAAPAAADRWSEDVFNPALLEGVT